MIGRTISHYQITEQLGQGGMGVVYKAQDTRLDRTVALKFLSPHSLPTDAEKARFYREAKAAAKLNHPHIATVFEIDETDDGQAFIVMEYVEGETLAEKIKRGPLKLEEAITIVCQVVEGLQAAHEAGIVHRDIKSSNIMLTAKGQVKVMDFGLAKVEAASMLTKEGTTLGTVSYMSPEQARGEEVDHRSDIWSLGVVLYEMVTGRLPFGGDYEQAMVYSILNQDPQPLTALRTGVPMALDWVMAKLLAKDPAQRYQHADEVVVDLEAIEIEATGLSQASLVAATSGTMTARPASSGLERSLAAGATPKAPLSWKIRLPIATALLLVGVLMGWFLRPGPPTPDKQVIPFSVLLPEEVQVSNTGRHSIALSPDGSHVAYIANEQVYLASLDDLESVHPLRGTPGREVFFSPDSRWIGFRNGLTGQLMKVAVTGGSPVPLTTTAELLFGAMWAEDGMIYYGQGPEGFYRVSENGGDSERILAPDSADAGQTLHGPQLLPDGRQVLFTLRPGSTQDWDESQIMILSLETGTTIRLLAGTDARYVSTGHLVYGLGGDVYGAPYDLRSGRLGNPVRLLADVRRGENRNSGAIQFTAANNTGLLAYIPVKSESSWRMVWVDESGNTETIFSDVGQFTNPAVSPGGRHIAVTVVEEREDQVWIYDVARGSREPVVNDNDLRTVYPVWSPDSTRLAFAATRDTGLDFDVYVRDVTLAGEAELLVDYEDTIVPNSWSKDGRYLAVSAGLFSFYGSDILIADLGSDEITPFLATDANESQAAFSPDGTWVAYMSNTPGNNEIYITPFPGPGAPLRVSTGGGASPVWSVDGRTLYYQNNRTAVYAVDIPEGRESALGTPRLLFDGVAFAPWFRNEGTTGQFDIDPESQRFIMMEHPAGPDITGSDRDEIRFVVNWFEELKRLAPPGN